MHISPSSINDMLVSSVEAFVREMFPAGVKQGSEWCIGGLDGSKGESLKIHLTGNKAGLWKDFASDGKGGDLLDLIQQANRCTLKEAIDEACSFLGVQRPTFQGHRKVEYKRPEKKATFKPLDKAPAASKWLLSRGFNAETLAAYKVIADTANGREAVVFPYLRGGELIHLKFRDAKEKKFWTSAETEKCLFGWQAIAPNARTVILTEGEADAMALYQYGYPAMSIPFGGGGKGKQEWIENEFDNLERFDMIYLALDSDEAGQIALAEIIDRLGRHRCKVVQLPMKDANECLMKGVPLDVIVRAFDESKTLDPAELRNAIEYRDAIVRRFHPLDNKVNGFYMPWESSVQAFNFEYGTTTILAGYNGHGKTTVIGHIVVDAIHQGVDSCVASLEFKPDKWLAAIVRQSSGEMIPNPSRIDKALEFLGKRLWAFDVGGKGMGTARVERILEVFAYARARYGIRLFVIDNFTKLGIAEDDYNAQKEAMVKMTEFAVEHDVVMLIAAHLKKAETGDSARGGKHGVRGAGALTDLPDNLWICHRNRKKEGRLKEIEFGLQSRDLVSDEAVKLRQEKLELEAQADTMLYCEKYRNGDDEPRIKLFYDRVSHQFMDSPTNSARRYV